MGADFEVCPFELQIAAAKEADAVICDYNYVFAPRSALSRISGIELEQEGKPNLAIDEAHNLIARSLEYYSPELSSSTLEKMRADIQRLPEKHSKKTLKLLDDCLAAVASAGPKDCRQATLVDPPAHRFLEQDAILREHLSNYLKSDVEIFPRDPVMRLCFYWAEFSDALQFVAGGRKEFFTTFQPFPPAVKITCCDASSMLKECYGQYSSVVGFSATLKPFDYYIQLSGLGGLEVRSFEFTSPFPKSNRKIIFVPQISSKYSERERNYQKIAEAIEKVTALKRGNYFAFFPSFDFMNRVAGLFNPPPGFEVLLQRAQMHRDAVQEILQRLSFENSAHVLFGV